MVRLRAGMLGTPWRWLPRGLRRRAPHALLLLARLAGQDRAVGCSKINTGLLAALQRRRAVRALSCGVYLCFGRVGGESPPTTWEHDGGALPFAPGGRVMAIRGRGDGGAVQGRGDGGAAQVETWIATAGGTEDRVSLPPLGGEAVSAEARQARARSLRAVALAVGVPALAWWTGTSLGLVL